MIEEGCREAHQVMSQSKSYRKVQRLFGLESRGFQTLTQESIRFRLQLVNVVRHSSAQSTILRTFQ